jgi:Tol biopolymer transport system component
VPYGAVDPAWSPDGKRIAYTRRTANRSSDIWVMNADGSGNRPLSAYTTDREVDPTWSPNGAWIAYARGPWEQQHVWALRADGTGIRRISAASSVEANPAWS